MKDFAYNYTCTKLKTSYEVEPYLILNINRFAKCALARFRLGKSDIFCSINPLSDSGNQHSGNPLSDQYDPKSLDLLRSVQAYDETALFRLFD